MLVFEERGKPEKPEKNLSEQGREPTTNSTHIWRRVRESNPGHIGGRRVLSPLRNPWSPSVCAWTTNGIWIDGFIIFSLFYTAVNKQQLSVKLWNKVQKLHFLLNRYVPFWIPEINWQAFGEGKQVNNTNRLKYTGSIPPHPPCGDTMRQTAITILKVYALINDKLQLNVSNIIVAVTFT